MYMYMYTKRFDHGLVELGASGPGTQTCFMKLSLSWVAVKELNSSYHNL